MGWRVGRAWGVVPWREEEARGEGEGRKRSTKAAGEDQGPSWPGACVALRACVRASLSLCLSLRGEEVLS